ncbi:MAG: filamentous hemagglutinin N-terminal domain-containing protein [Elainellaceae cyanobacterium]
MTHFPHLLYPVLMGAAGLLLSALPGMAQSLIVPDETLGEERSQVIENFFGLPIEVILGGAQRQQNLFHSFAEFNVDEGRGAFFFSPDDVSNIFSRVTGNNPSSILGTLGTFGSDANLFFVNPNGIFFGPNSSVDVAGSFMATTADAIQFGEQGFFSAADPEAASSLLTIDPSAYWFNQVPQGNITVQANLEETVPAGQDLTLLGGDVRLDGGQISLINANLFLGGLAAPGRVTVDADGNLGFPAGGVRSSFGAVNSAVSVVNGGGIQIQSDNFILDGSTLSTGTVGADNANAGNISIQAGSAEIRDNSSIFSISLDSSTGSPGDLTLDARTLALENNGSMFAVTQNQADGSTITVRAEDSVRLTNGSRLLTNSSSTGTGGDIVIESAQLRLESSEDTQSAFLSAETFGGGDGGSIAIRASDSIELVGPRSSISVIDRTDGSASGNLGDITIDTQTLSLSDGARISGRNFGAGDGGRLIIRSTDAVRLSNRSTSTISAPEPAATSIDTTVFGTGTGGAIAIETGVLEIEADGIGPDGSVEGTASILAGTEGPGNGGSVTIQARQSIRLNNGTISATTGGDGQGGNVLIETGQLQLLNTATISTGTGTLDAITAGDAGDITIRAADSIELSGTSQFPSALVPNINSRSSFSQGNSGNIVLETERLSIRDGGAISTEVVSSSGNAGNLTIRAADIALAGWRPGPGGTSGRSQLSTGVIGTQPGVEGGTLTIETQRLTLRDGASVNASATGNDVDSFFGVSGNLVIQATDFIDIDGSTGPRNLAGDQFVAGLFAELQNVTGQGGSINIETGELRLRDGAQIGASTFANGDAGDIAIRADRILIGGFSGDDAPSGIAALVAEGAEGNGGNLSIETGRLVMREGGGISASTFGQGNAGSLTIRAEDIELIGETQPPIITSQVLETAAGDAGNILIHADRLTLRAGGQIVTSTSGQGNAGNLTIQGGEVRLLGTANGLASAIFSTVERQAVGNAGDQTIQADRLIVRDGAGITASTSGEGQAGDITIRAGDIELSGVGEPSEVDDEAEDDTGASGIFAIVASDAVGRGGDVRISTDRFVIQAGATVSTITSGAGRAGDIRIEAGDRIQISGVNQRFGSPGGISARTLEDAQGRAGDISLSAASLSISDGATINAQTLNRFPSGNITLNARTFAATNGGQVISNTASTGLAGDITLNGERVTLAGREPTFSERVAEFGDRVTNEGTGQSGLFANTRPDSAGRGGRITVNATDLSIQDEGIITTQTEGEGSSGAINLNIGRSLEMDNSAQIISSTAGQGDAGNVEIRVSDTISLVNSTIASEVTETASGEGGDITIRAGAFDLIGSQISSRSDRGLDAPNAPAPQTTATSNNQSNAGNILIVVDDILFIQDSDITTQAAAFAGGAITVRAGDIRLFGDGDIQTSVQSGTAGGGDITLTADTILAFDDSDILAFAADGQGGNITLDTDIFFGENFTPISLEADPEGLDGNDRVDINATGAFSGTVTLPDVSFIQNSLAGLPAGLINTEALIANSCVARNADGSSTFVITGAGGLPARPEDLGPSPYPTGDVQTIPEDSSQSWQPGDPIIEPDGVYQLPNGDLILSHACPSSRP